MNKEDINMDVIIVKNQVIELIFENNQIDNNIFMNCVNVIIKTNQDL